MTYNIAVKVLLATFSAVFLSWVVAWHIGFPQDAQIMIETRELVQAHLSAPPGKSSRVERARELEAALLQQNLRAIEAQQNSSVLTDVKSILRWHWWLFLAASYLSFMVFRPRWNGIWLVIGFSLLLLAWVGPFVCLTYCASYFFYLLSMNARRFLIRPAQTE